MFRNYDAISWALCYPASNKKGNELAGSHPLSAAGTNKVLDWLAGNNFNGEGAKPFTKQVVQVITGNTVESRWYLPSVLELQKVYTAGAKLLNWSDLSNEKFWSVEVNTYSWSQASDYKEADEKLAKYVDFSTGNGATMNKFGEPNKANPNDDKDNYYNDYDKIKVLAIAQFNYTTM